MNELLKHFIIFYFSLNVIITIIAFIFDRPSNFIKEYGYMFFFKSIMLLMFGGIICVTISAIKY